MNFTQISYNKIKLMRTIRSELKVKEPTPSSKKLKLSTCCPTDPKKAINKELVLGGCKMPEGFAFNSDLTGCVRL